MENILFRKIQRTECQETHVQLIPQQGNEDKPFSMSDYKTMYNNTLMLERFICMFAINPNTPKNQKIFKEVLNYGKIAA